MVRQNERMNNMMRTSTIFGLMAVLAAGCQSGDSSSTASEAPPAPPAGEQAAAGGYGGGPPATGVAPALPVSPAGGGGKVGIAGKPKSSFDGSPDGGGAAGGGQIPGGAPGGGADALKPRPIRPGVKVALARNDPFVSFIAFIIEKPPAYSLAVPDRLAPPPKIGVPEGTPRPEDLLPLPQVPRRVAGVLYNGAITAILETGEPPNSETTVISPGAKVPSGIPGIPDLTVDSIAMDRLVLRAEDGRTVEVKLSALPPSVQQSLSQQFNGGGGGGAAGGGGMGGGPGFGGGGPRGGGGGAAMGGGGFGGGARGGGGGSGLQ